uniref:phosphotransferase n=1 Tax=Flavobacterium sp. TaxID=239 RepID=UPI00404B7831
MKYFLDLTDKNALSDYLKSRKFMHSDENIAGVSIPGAGNMNFVVRVQFENRSVIVKQAREYVEKYPQIPAPKSRIEVEAAFYQEVSKNEPIQKMMPSILGLDVENSILILEDLGDGFDYSFLYDLEEKLNLSEIETLTNYLVQLHEISASEDANPIFENKEMRQLNYEHIFVYPFMENNGFDLDTIQIGLQNVASFYQNNPDLKSKIESIGAHYLANGTVLLHGDYYPGSWLKTTNGIKVIDTEFCFYGNPAFDLGIFIAHLHLTQHDATTIEKVLAFYTEKRAIDMQLVENFISVEIIRRLIGLAQLPLSKMTLKTKADLLDLAYHKIMKS